MPTLSKENQVLLDSCMDAIRDVVGDAFSEKKIVETIIKFDYDFTKSLDAILNPEKVDPPQGLKVTLPPATAVTSDKGEFKINLINIYSTNLVILSCHLCVVDIRISEGKIQIQINWPIF